MKSIHTLTNIINRSINMYFVSITNLINRSINVYFISILFIF